MYDPLLLQIGSESLFSNVWVLLFLFLFLVPTLQRRFLEQTGVCSSSSWASEESPVV